MVGPLATQYQVTLPISAKASFVTRASARPSYVASAPAISTPLARKVRESSAPPPRMRATLREHGSHRIPARAAAVAADLVHRPSVNQTRTLAATHEPACAVTSSHGTSNDYVQVNGRTFERLRELGHGSFGVVWEIQEHTLMLKAAESRPSLALKYSTPAHPQMLEACLFEADVLRQLGATLPTELVKAHRVPQYVTHARTSQGAGNNCVLLAMSKLEGKPLDKWLYGVDECYWKTVDMARFPNGLLPGSKLATRNLAGACNFAATLLSQIVPVFDALSNIAYHRDISGHNFMIREVDGVEQFAVLDFGLAVPARTWEREWQTRNIAGDPRYFSPAVWMMMAYGLDHLVSHPDKGFQHQYMKRIDHYALGFLTLEMLFALWDGSTGSENNVESGEATSRYHHALVKVRAAWRLYFADAVVFFQRFHAEGGDNFTRALAGSQDVPRFLNKLKVLCSALEDAAALATDRTEAAVLRSAAGLIDWRSSLSWQDITGMLSEEGSKVEVQASGATGNGGYRFENALGAAAMPVSPKRTPPPSPKISCRVSNTMHVPNAISPEKVSHHHIRTPTRTISAVGMPYVESFQRTTDQKAVNMYNVVVQSGKTNFVMNSNIRRTLGGA